MKSKTLVTSFYYSFRSGKKNTLAKLSLALVLHTSVLTEGRG